MKKIVVGITMVTLFCLPSMLLAAGIGGLFGKKEAPKVNVDGLTSRSTAVMSLVQKASVYFAESVVAIHEAVGNKEKAERLKQNMADFKSKPGQQTQKTLMTNVGTDLSEIEKNETIAQINAEEAQKFMGQAVLGVGVGILLDGLAVQNAGPLLNEAQGALKQAPITSAGKINEVIDVGQFVTQEVPPQISTVKTFSGRLIDYAKAKGIALPSAEDTNKKYELEKN